LLVCLRQPDRQVSSTPPIWLPSSPPLSLRSPCQRGLPAVAPCSDVVRRRVWVCSMRRRPLHALPSAPPPRTTRLSQTPPPTVHTRSRRTRGRARRRPLWAARWMGECRAQRIVEFVLVTSQYTAARPQWDRSVGPCQTQLAQHPHGLTSVATSATWLSSSPSAHPRPAPTAANVTCATTAMAMAAA
jgi:hypothetical protein